MRRQSLGIIEKLETNKNEFNAVFNFPDKADIIEDERMPEKMEYFF